jgi:cytochrome c oxidase assembly protein subunit 15/protoheme IX farnesyltransferase
MQIAVGAASILLQAPLPLQLLHLLIADALWITLVLFTAEAAVRK